MTANQDRTNFSTHCTVLVCSCDKYADILGPFVVLWRRFWPDCPFETVLVTETAANVPDGFDRVLAYGAGGNWCSRLVRALDEIATPRVLMLCDDYFLASPVDTALILRRLGEAERENADNLRLVPNPKPTRAVAAHLENGLDLFRYRPNVAYSISTLAGFWKREFLRRLAQGRSSIWEFERFGSFDPAAAAATLLVTPTREFPFVDAVHKGHWEPFGLDVCRANGLDLSRSGRTLPPLKTRLVESAKALVFALFPATLIVRVQNALNVGAKEKMV